MISLLFQPLDCDMQKRDRPAEAGNCKRRASKTNKRRARTEGISTVFFASQNKQVQKSIEIPRSRLLQFAARAIHCHDVEEVFPWSSKCVRGRHRMAETRSGLGRSFAPSARPAGTRQKRRISPIMESRIALYQTSLFLENTRTTRRYQAIDVSA